MWPAGSVNPCVEASWEAVATLNTGLSVRSFASAGDGRGPLGMRGLMRLEQEQAGVPGEGGPGKPLSLPCPLGPGLTVSGMALCSCCLARRGPAGKHKSISESLRSVSCPALVPVSLILSSYCVCH